LESVKEAKVRSQAKKRKRPHGPPSIDRELDRLMADVNTWTSVNWSQKAREYKIRKAGLSTSPPLFSSVITPNRKLFISLRALQHTVIDS